MEEKQKIQIVYFGHGLAGYYGIKKLMTGKLKDEIDIREVVVSNNPSGAAEIVRECAKMHGLIVSHYPYDANNLAEKIKKYKADMGIVMNFDRKIDEEIIFAFPKGMWNVHPSNLPKYRGGLPLESIIVNGDEYRCTVHEMTGKFDEGDIIYKSAPVKIYDMDIDELYSFSSKQSALALEDALSLMIEEKITKIAQDNTAATYANKKDLDKLLHINWQRDNGEMIYQKIIAGGKGRGAISSIVVNDKEKNFRVTEANYVPFKQTKEDYGKVSVFDDCYAVNVRGGTIYFKATFDDPLIKETLDTNSIILE